MTGGLRELSRQEKLVFDDWRWLAHELETSTIFESKLNKLVLTNPPTVASFFAGCGGMDLGLHWAGFDIVYANEIDPAAAKTYSSNLPSDVDNRSILDVDLGKIPPHDLLVGGFPCQPFSYAGKRKGLLDDRGLLFLSLVEDLYVNRPKHFIFENVRGLLTHLKGNTFNNVKQAIRDAGYALTYSVLNAADFGCAQSRERLFIVGTRNDCLDNFVFPDVSARRLTVKEVIGSLLTRADLPNNEPMKHTKRILERYKFIPQGGSMKDVPQEHQQRKRGDVSKVSGKMSSQSYHRLNENTVSPTICAMFQAHFIHYSEDRNLTAREAARLQSFPDDFIFEGKRVNMSWDTELSQYQQIGNAVAPKMAYVLGRSLYEQCLRSIGTLKSSNN
jgi:DNA (cytosine-5)-methyltransferase 1